ncbi:MAG: DNA polymerase III subunit [Pedosphaera sp.]|nr:DNA polymerase III subunit [Pedosphaera sp.]
MSFVNFPGQGQAVELLQRSLSRGRLGHTYLFSGASLDDLGAVARILAKTINCQKPTKHKETGAAIDSCDSCASCRKIDGERHPDVQWLRPESKSRVITIEQIRELLQTINLKPTEASYKVAVIVAADRLNVQAANAFLKTLEEPPSRSVLILLSTDPQRILETILSRCLRLTFAGETKFDLESPNGTWLRAFCQMTSAVRQGLLARYQLLGMLLQRLAELKEETEKTLAANSPLEKHDEIEPRLREKWESELAAAVEAEYRRRRGELLLALQWWLRDVWLLTKTSGQELLAYPSLGETSQIIALRVSPASAANNLHVLDHLQWQLGSNVQEALALEVGLLRLKL